MKILVLEGDRDQLLSLETRLTEEGHEIRGAYSGKWGLKMWRSFGPFDVVITDYSFVTDPSSLVGEQIKNGLELIAAIRAVDPLQGFILQTSGENLTVPFGVKLLKKPYAFRRLLRLLEPSAQGGLRLSY